MKKLIVAGVLALLVVAVSQERASAWFRIKLGGCLHVGVEGTLPCFHFGFCPGPPPCHHDGNGLSAWPAYHLPYGHGSAHYGPSAPSYTAPAPRPVEPQTYSNSWYGNGVYYPTSFSNYYSPYASGPLYWGR